MLEYIIGIAALLRLYNGLSFFLIKRRMKGPVEIMRGAEPFFIKKRGKKVALMLHGFTSSPKEFKGAAKFLSKNGISCYAPLLPGHGTTPERLAITKYVQWIEYVEETIKMLSNEYKEIYLIGNSFGGNLALISTNVSDKIKGVVVLGTPIFFPGEKLKRYLIFPIAKRIKLFQKKKYTKRANMERINKKRRAYDSIPLKSISHFLRIVEQSKKSLKEIEAPILVMHARDDEVAREDSADYIIENVKSKNKKLVVIPESYHVFILDKYALRANKEMLKFIKEN